MINSLSREFDRFMPAHRTYLGCSRRVILALFSAIFLALLVIAIALGVSLRKGPRGQDLPLPSSTESFTGDLTYYAPGLGACGITSADRDSICAVSHIIFDAVANGSDPNANPLCGLKIRANRFNELAEARRSVDLKVVDRCTGCAIKDIDVSPGAFRKLADPSRGRVDVTWAWLSPAPTT